MFRKYPYNFWFCFYFVHRIWRQNTERVTKWVRFLWTEPNFTFLSNNDTLLLIFFDVFWRWDVFPLCHIWIYNNNYNLVHRMLAIWWPNNRVSLLLKKVKFQASEKKFDQCSCLWKGSTLLKVNNCSVHITRYIALHFYKGKMWHHFLLIAVPMTPKFACVHVWLIDWLKRPKIK